MVSLEIIKRYSGLRDACVLSRTINLVERGFCERPLVAVKFYFSCIYLLFRSMENFGYTAV